MLKILRKRSSPMWFQELTDEQCSICDQILDAIGDDLDERTFHRSKGLLRKLGIFPLCQDRITRTALMLCNRNDISFLWLLLELYYIRRPGRTGTTELEAGYSINERLLLSSIAHLDMMTTLRGLDMILPPRKRLNSDKVEDKKTGTALSSKESPLISSPYKKPFVVKKTGYTVPLKMHPHRDEFLGRYSRYRDPEYIVRNEESRWFAKCSGSGRNLFSCKGYISVSQDATESETETESLHSAEAIVKALLDENIRKMIDRVECCKMLCPKHHTLDEGCTNLLWSLQRNTPVREALMASVRSQCARWKEEELRSDGKRQVENLLSRLVDEAVSLAILEPAGNCPDCWQRFDMQQKLRLGQKCVCSTSEDKATIRATSMEETKQQYFKFSKIDSSHPYQFHYGNIFEDDEERQKEQLACPIKSAIRRTLLVENDTENVDVDHAIDNFMRSTWHEELKNQRERLVEEQNKLKQMQPQETDLLSKDYIETKDATVLQKILKSALRRLAEHPMYILATFPEVDKLPILIAWIRDRYGVPIGPSERAAALLESKLFWDTLIPRATAVRWPTRKDTGLKSTINWNYKKKLEAKAGKLMCTFQRRFKNVQVQEGRLWWTSMVPYHAGADRFRQTFSAYFPNCEPSIVPAFRTRGVHTHRAIPTIREAQ
uniref:Uncharacterized protein n=1 Tax=Anopheles atroparvus TaxID=41427 RepID=A0AAG5DML4_ANOAO